MLGYGMAGWIIGCKKVISSRFIVIRRELEVLIIMDNPPALISLQYSSKEHRRLDITGLKRRLKKLLDDNPLFRTDQDIRRELYIYGKILYKMNGPFRRHGHFQMAKRLKKLLENCFDDDDEGQLKRASIFLREFTTSIRLDDKDNLYCPSAEYFRFILNNLRCLASIFVKIAQCCVDFCDRMMHMLNFGHFVQVHCLLLGVVAGFRSDSCRRLGLIKDFMVDFTDQGHLDNGLRLKFVNPGINFDDLGFVFQLDDVDKILDQDRSVNSENLTPESRKQATDYFEALFNVRLAKEREKRKRMTGKDRKYITKDIDFRQALGVKSAGSSKRDDLDMGIPIDRETGNIEDDSSKLGKFLVQIDRIKSVKSMREFGKELERIPGRRFVPAIRLVKKELEEMKKLESGEKKLVKALKRARFRLKHLLAKK